jgi:hypothetical protein
MALALVAAACSPALDWREIRLADTPLRASWPCRPASHARPVPLAGQSLVLTLHACEAEGVTYAMGWVDSGDPARNGEVLNALAAAAAVNLGATTSKPAAYAFKGMTPHPAAGLHELQGRLAGGLPGQARVAVFVVGTQVFQVTALGARLPAEPVQTFFASIGVTL